MAMKARSAGPARKRGNVSSSNTPEQGLSGGGILRRCILAAALGVAGAADAATFGSPAWFAARQDGSASGSGGLSNPSGAAKPPGAQITTPDEAIQASQRSMADISRAADAIAAAQKAQNAARQIAIEQTSNIPNGLTEGGLKVADGVPVNLDNPQAGDNPNLWRNAELPSQSVNNGQTRVTVEQTDKKAVLTWETFNVGKQTRVHFDQSKGTLSDGTNDWAVLNRVMDPNERPSRVLGRIEAEGSVFLMNRNGITFGGGSQVNVHALVASSMEFLDGARDLDGQAQRFIENDALAMEGILEAEVRLDTDGKIAMPGDIRIEEGAVIESGEGGATVLAAPRIVNEGTLLAPDGQAVLVATLGNNTGVIGANVDFQSATANNQANNDALIPRYSRSEVVAVWDERDALNERDVLVEDLAPELQEQISALDRGTVINRGRIESKRGSVRIAAPTIKQDGVIAASTSVSRQGAIHLVAADMYANYVNRDVQGGRMVMTPDSLIAILPELDGETTESSAEADDVFIPPTVSLQATDLRMQSGSLLLVPGGTVDLLGHQPVRNGNPTTATQERVYVDDRATINVSGLANVLKGMADNLVEIPRVGLNELADSPLQRDGLLYRQSVYVDRRRFGIRSDGLTWWGSPILNAEGYIKQVPRTINELLIHGGKINLVGREVVARDGSRLELGGGFLHYEGGKTRSIRLVGADGQVHDLANADPMARYIGIAGQYNREHSRWNQTTSYTDPLLSGQLGSYKAPYIEGGDAGHLTIYATDRTVLNADVSARALIGRRQMNSGQLPEYDDDQSTQGDYADADIGQRLPRQGTFTLTSSGWAQTIGVGAELDDPLRSAGVGEPVLIQAKRRLLPSDFGEESALPDSTDDDRLTVLSTQWLNDAGFGAVTVNRTQRGLRVGASADLQVAAGGQVNLNGAGQVEVNGRLSAPSGNISVQSRTFSGGQSYALDPLYIGAFEERGASGILLGNAAELDASGLWVNDTGADQDQVVGKAFVDGGEISLQVLTGSELRITEGSALDEQGNDITGALKLAPKARLDISSGGYVTPLGRLATNNGLPIGRAGDLTLGTYVYSSKGRSGTQSILDSIVARSEASEETGQLLFSPDNIVARGFEGGGILSLHAKNFLIGDGVTSSAGVVGLPSSFFQAFSFDHIELAAAGGVRVKENSNIVSVSKNVRYADIEAAISLPTGGDIHKNGITIVDTLPTARRPARGLTLRSGEGLFDEIALDLADFTVDLPNSSTLIFDPDAEVTLSGRGGLTVSGMVSAPGGEILLSSDNSGGGFDEGVTGSWRQPGAYASTLIKEEAVIDVSGTTILDPWAQLGRNSGLANRAGEVIDGGRIILTSNEGEVIFEDGASLRLSGARDELDVPTNNNAGYERRLVWSDAGQLDLVADIGLFLDGGIQADGGHPEARGGSLYLNIGQNTRGVLVQQSGDWLVGDMDAADQPSGLVRLTADTLNESGIETLSVTGVRNRNLNIGVLGDVTLDLDRAVLFDEVIGIRALAEDATDLDDPPAPAGAFTVKAPYIRWSGSTNADNHQGLDPGPSATLIFQADKHIDLGGRLSLVNWGRSEFISGGDIRFVTQSEFYEGSGVERGERLLAGLDTGGDLLFKGARIYPATSERFAIRATGAADPDTGESVETTVTFERNGKDFGAPLSAGGQLLVDATLIRQNGVLRAPGGRIVLGVTDPDDVETQALFGVENLVATDSVVLGQGSVTSVSLDGRTIPWGYTVDGRDWRYGYQGGANPGHEDEDILAPPEKGIELAGVAVDFNKGALLDASGGGDLQAQEWIPGTGGTRDILQRYDTVYTPQSGNDGEAVPLYPDERQIYAILPGSGPVAPYDPALVSYLGGMEGHLYGQSVQLSGGEGIPAGTYTLLPAKYATLPGAYRVVAEPDGRDALAGHNHVLADGTDRVAGYVVDALTGARDARTTLFSVQSRPVWRQYSEYQLSSANRFFGEGGDGVAPRLPLDAGRVSFAARSELTLGGTTRFGAPQGGRGGQVDIAAQRMAVVGADGEPLGGYLNLNVDELSGLNAASLLLGGSRHQHAEGTGVTTVAEHLVVDTSVNDPLTGTDLILVAGVGEDPAASGVEVREGSVIRAEGEASGGVDRLILGRDADPENNVDAINGDGALLRVSALGGAPVSRRGLGDAPRGRLRIGENVVLDGSAGLTLDGAGGIVAAPSALLDAPVLSLNSGAVSFVDDPDMDAPGLVIGPATLDRFADTETLVLRSYDTMRFLSALDLRVANNLTLSARAFRTDGHDVSLTADALTLANQTGGSGTAAAGTATLDLRANNLYFGEGEAALSGFGTVNGRAARALIGAGRGTLDAAGADVIFTTPLVQASAGSDAGLRTTGDLGLLALTSDPALPYEAEPALGGAMRFTGGTVTVETPIRANSGTLNLRASAGDVTLGDGATLDAGGVARDFFDVTRHTSGGVLNLTADRGDIVLAEGAALDAAAPEGGGDGGRLALEVGDAGALHLDGSVTAGAGGTGDHQGQGGSLSLTSGGGIDLDFWAGFLEGAGITNELAFTSGAGNLALSQGNQLMARRIELTADGARPGAGQGEGGWVMIDGTLDASGGQGGTIEAFGQGGVAINGTLDASGDTGQGGRIVLGTTGEHDGTYHPDHGYQNVQAADSGTLRLGQDADIRLAGGEGARGGTLTLRAPLLDTGDVNVELASADGIQGAGRVDLEAYATWATDDGTTGDQHFDGIVDPAGWFDGDGNRIPGRWVNADGEYIDGEGDPEKGDTFVPDEGAINRDHRSFYEATLAGFVRNPGFTFEDRFTEVEHFAARPGIVLSNPDPDRLGGDIRVLTPWNLGAGTLNADGSISNRVYRYNGQAPVLTLAAERDLDIEASISDGFFQFYNDTLNPELSFTSLAEAQAAYSSLTQYLRIPPPIRAQYPIQAPDVFGDDVDQSRASAFYNQYIELMEEMNTRQFGINSMFRLQELVFYGAMAFGFTGQAPAGPEAPSSLSDYSAYLDSYVDYVADTVGVWRPGTPVPAFEMPAPVPAQLSDAGFVSESQHTANSVSPVAVWGDRVPLISMQPVPGASSDYRLIAGTDFDSAQPRTISSAQGSVRVQGSGSYQQKGGGGSTYNIPIPTLVRTGDAHIQVRATDNVELNAGAMPGLVYTAGEGAPGAAGRVSQLKEISLPFGLGGDTTTDTLSAGSESLGYSGGVDVVAGGDIHSQEPDNPNDRQFYDWLGQEEHWTSSVGDQVDFGIFRYGLLSVGGDLRIRAGGDIIDLSASAVHVEEGGSANLDMRAGGDIRGGDVMTSRGRGRVMAGGSITSGNYGHGLVVGAAGDSEWWLRAGRGLELGDIVRVYNEGPFDGSSLSLATWDGDILVDRFYDGVDKERGANGSVNGHGAFSNAAPASVQATAFNGDLALHRVTQLAPSDQGNFNLLARGTVSLSYLNLLDLPLDVALGGNGDNTSLGLHLDDTEPARIYAINGDVRAGETNLYQVEEGQVVSAIKTWLLAGQDIDGIKLTTRQYYGSDVTRLEAARDLIDNQVTVNGPGTLLFQSGRDIRDPELRTEAPLVYTSDALAGDQADIAIRFGVAPGMDTNSFAQRYIQPGAGSESLAPFTGKLVDFIVQYQSDEARRQGNPAPDKPDTEKAWAIFQTLPQWRRQILVDQVFTQILNQVGLDYNDTGSDYMGQYGRGYQAINRLFPADYGYTANNLGGGPASAAENVHTGDMDMRGHLIRTDNGGDIHILGPGGELIIGSTAAPPAGSTAAGEPEERGVLALGQGDIGIFTDRSVLLAQSRIFNLRGGTLAMWSSNGNINAGKGAKTSSATGVVDINCSPSYVCRPDPVSQVSGAGIAALQIDPEGEPGTANLMAPRGTVDAGEAGIRVDGLLNVAAFAVANADNIQVSGQSIGVPTGLVDVGSLSVASAANAAAQQAAEDLSSNQPRNDAASMITVEVVGFGRPSEEQRRKLGGES